MLIRRFFRSGAASLGTLVYCATVFSLALSFTMAAIQGDHGLFRRAAIEAETRALQGRLNGLEAEVARMENLTLRLSDDYLDIDLLDEQARSILGLLRHDEIMIPAEAPVLR